MVHRVRGIYLDSSRSSRANSGEHCRQRQASHRGACSEREGRDSYTGSRGKCCCNNECSSRGRADGGERDSRAGYACCCRHRSSSCCTRTRSRDGRPRGSDGRLHVRREAA